MAYKPRETGSYKQALSELVDACGGLAVVAGLIGASTSHVGRMIDDAHPKTEMRMAHVLLLQRQCGQRIVTDWLAAEQGCIVEHVDVGCHDSLPVIFGRITKETGEVLSAAAKDMQRGALTQTNARLVLDETDDVICAALTLRAHAKAVLAAATQCRRGS